MWIMKDDIVRYDEIMKNEDITRYNYKMKDKIGLMNLVYEDEILTKFNGIKLISENAKYEKNKFIVIDFNLVGVILILIAVFFIITHNESVPKLCVSIILVILGGIVLWVQDDSEKDCEIKQPPKLYMADCYVYEIIKRERMRSRRGIKLYRNINYYAKITDMVSGYLKEEIRMIGVKECTSNEMIKAQLYVIEENGKYYKYIEKT